MRQSHRAVSVLVRVMAGVVLAAVVLALATGRSARAADEPRIALVMGNGGYSYGALPNPPNDARAIAGALETVGFEVDTVLDASQREMKRAIVDFGERLAAAGPTAVGLFYYAGHGVQANGANYLIPLDADLRRVADLDIEAVEAEWALLQMREAGNAVNFLILDACRDNPLPRGLRTSIGGLARMDAPVGTFVAYATSPGATAEDGAGGNSPYTTALVEHLHRDGLAAEILFRNVRNRVIELTDGRQVPWDSSSLRGGDFCFAGCGGGAAVEPGAAAETVNEDAVELAYWSSIRDSDDPSSFEAYLADYPNGAFRRLAEVRLAALTAEPEIAAPAPASESITAREDATPARPPQKPGATAVSSGAPSNVVSGEAGAGSANAAYASNPDPVQGALDLIAGRWRGQSQTLDFVTNTWMTNPVTVEIARTGPSSARMINGSVRDETEYDGRAFWTLSTDTATGLTADVEGRYTRVEGPNANGDAQLESEFIMANTMGAVIEMRSVLTVEEGRRLSQDTRERPYGSFEQPILADHTELTRADR